MNRLPQLRETFPPVTLGHIRGHGCHSLLIYCGSIACNHSAIDARRSHARRHAHPAARRAHGVQPLRPCRRRRAAGLVAADQQETAGIVDAPGSPCRRRNTVRPFRGSALDNDDD